MSFSSSSGVPMFNGSSSSLISSDSSDTITEVIGFAAIAVSILGFGSNFVPVKKFPTGDGVYFQWVMCSAIWCFGLMVNAIRGFPKFEPLAMLGGLLWCSGNILAVPIIKLVGLALGLSLWGVSNLLMGWGSGTFGWFHLTPETVLTPAFNYAGAAVCCCAVLLFAFVPKNEEKAATNKTLDDEAAPLLLNINDSQKDTPKNFVDRMTPWQKRLLGIVLSLISGVFYGTNFDPPQYLIDHSDEGHSTNGLDYVFSHFCGIYATSTLYFIIYSICKRNQPDMFNTAFIPGWISGAIWALAQTSWFIANSDLSMVISFPLIATGPGLIAALWGVFLFKEIRGVKALLILGAAFLVTITGVVFITLSQLVEL